MNRNSGQPWSEMDPWRPQKQSGPADERPEGGCHKGESVATLRHLCRRCYEMMSPRVSCAKCGAELLPN
jgi:hypothetical protein